MNKFKKITAAVMAAALMTGTAVTVNAEDSKFLEYEGIVYYELDDGTLEALGNTNKSAVDIVIPETVNGKAVTSVDFAITNPNIDIEVRGNLFKKFSEKFTSLSIPKTVKNVIIYGNCEEIKNFKVDLQNEYYTSIDGVLFSKDKKTLVSYPHGREDKKYTIPNGVAEIGRSSFIGNKSLANIEIPDSVTKINDYAFAACDNLTKVIIPNGVTKLGNRCFEGCNNLKSIYLPKSISQIAAGAFYIDTKASYSEFDLYYEGSKEDWNKIKLYDGILVSWDGNERDNIEEHGDNDDFMEKIKAVKATMHYNSTPSAKPVIPDTPDTPAPKKPVYNSTTDVPGDIDGDGKPTARDATALLKYIVGLATLNGNSKQNADVNSDGSINAKDATQILKMVVGLA